MITHYLMVVVVSFASSVIVKKHVIRKAISKIERECLFLIQFMKDLKKLIIIENRRLKSQYCCR